MTGAATISPAQTGTGEFTQFVRLNPIDAVLVFDETEITILEFSATGVLSPSHMGVRIHTGGSAMTKLTWNRSLSGELSAWEAASDEDFDKFERSLD